LREHLNQDGKLFITTRFKNNYSLALEHNEYLDECFEQLIEDCELDIEIQRHMWGKDDKIKYLYVLKHKN